MGDKETQVFNPIKLGERAKRIRVEKEMTIQKLAELTGLNKNTIVRFEKGLNTRLDTAYNICNVLETSPWELIESELVKGVDFDIKKRLRNSDGAPIWQYVHRKKRIRTAFEEGLLIGDINYKLPDGQINAVVLEVYTRSKQRSHTGEEMLFCLTGKVGLKIGDKTAILHEGDAAFFWGSEMHSYFNADKDRKVSIALSVWVAKEHNITKVVMED